MKAETLAVLTAACADGRQVALARRLSDGTAYVLPDPAAPAGLNEAACLTLQSGRPGMQMLGDEAWFIEPHLPPPRLLLIGAVHIAQALVQLAAPVGLAATVIDPREIFADAARFPGVALCARWPVPALAALQPDAGTAIVTLTHDPKLDDPALEFALGTRAFYIGCLGSRKTHAARLARLRGRGHDDAALQRLHGPVGLEIGALQSAEIAVAILAQIIQVWRRA